MHEARRSLTTDLEQTSGLNLVGTSSRGFPTSLLLVGASSRTVEALKEVVRTE